jgi:anti-sigma B factor antagonist
MGEFLRVGLRTKGDTVTALLVGELDLAAREEVVAKLSATAASKVVVDLSDLTFVDAAGVQTLLVAKRAISGRGRSVELRGAQGVVRRVFELCDLDGELAD